MAIYDTTTDKKQINKEIKQIRSELKSAKENWLRKKLLEELRTREALLDN